MKPLAESKNSLLYETVLPAVFLPAAVILFDMQKPWAAIFLVCFCAAMYFFLRRNADTAEPHGSDSKIILYVSLVFIALKFWRLAGFPADFFGDESTYIYFPHATLTGNAGFLDYNIKFGISLPYICNLMTALAMKIIGHNLDLLRLIPVLVFCLTAYCLWKLAFLMKMPQAAPAFVFVYSMSAWAWKLTKLYLPNLYIPLFIVLFLVMFYMAVNTGSAAALAGSGLVFAAGFFTYGTWVLMLPFAVYLAIEYRKELGNKKLAGYIIFLLCFSAAALLIYLSKERLTATVAARTVFSAGSGAANPAAGSFMNLYKFFLGTIDTDMSFIKAPFFYAVEIMLLVFGLIHISLNFKTRGYRILLAGFLASLPVILFGASIAHPVRHAMTFTFASIICATGLNAVFSGRKFIFFLLPVYIFSALSFVLVYYFVWPLYMPQNRMDHNIAAYINKTYGHKALYINDTEPYGRYTAFLRTKTAYRNKNDLNFDYVVFTTPALWHRSLMEAFPEIEVKYFFESGSEAALWALPVKQDSKKYFYDMSINLARVDSLMWKEEHEAALELIRTKLDMSGARYGVLHNTFLKVHESTVYVKKQDLQALAACMMRPPYPVLELAGDYYFGGVMLETQKRFSEAYNYYERASRLAPEWTTPKAKMQLMKYLGKK